MATSIYVLLVLTCAAYSLTLNDILFQGGYDFIDLSHPIDNHTVYWPGVRRFEFIKKTEETGEDGSWYSAYEFAAGEHGGTHIDAPFHFYKEGKHLGEIPLENLIVPLIVVDISLRVNGNHSFVLHKHDVDYLLNTNMGKPCVIIFKFGWSKFYSTDMYLGFDESTKKLNFPGLSSEIAEWIAGYKNIVGVGVDVPSVDPGSSTGYPVHRILSRAGLYNIENVNFHQYIPDCGCTALILPFKTSGTGGPVRLVAICPKIKPISFSMK